MGSWSTRLDKLESHLTPGQAVLLCMAEAHQFQTLEEYAHHMKTQPDDAWPLRRLGDQMTASVEQVLKERPERTMEFTSPNVHLHRRQVSLSGLPSSLYMGITNPFLSRGEGWLPHESA